MKLLIVNKFNNEVYTSTDEANIEKAMQDAFIMYADDLDMAIDNKRNFPDAEYWQKQIDYYQSILDSGFEAITLDEYLKRERERYLNKEPKEITAKAFNDALNVLPPMKWYRNERYSMFFISEPHHLTFHAQFIFVKATGKYYTTIADVLDESTWIDKLLKLI